MKQYFQVDTQGKIVGTEFFEPQDAPPNYKLGWGDVIFFDPIWDYATGEWKENRELEEVLASTRNQKLGEMSNMCQESILAGFYSRVNGVEYKFKYDREAQLNFQDAYNLFQNNLLLEVGWTVRIGEEKQRIKLNKATFTGVYTDAIKHKNENINHLYEAVTQRVEAAKTLEEIRAIEWSEEKDKLIFKTDEMLNKKIDEISVIEKETSAQKGHNMYIETTLMEVVDIIFGGM